MSPSDFQSFLQKINSDGELRAELSKRFESGKDIPADELIAFAGQQGYAFTVDEVETELSEDALEGVAGGTGYIKFGDIKGESLNYMGKSEGYLAGFKYSPNKRTVTLSWSLK